MCGVPGDVSTRLGFMLMCFAELPSPPLLSAELAACRIQTPRAGCLGLFIPDAEKPILCRVARPLCTVCGRAAPLVLWLRDKNCSVRIMSAVLITLPRTSGSTVFRPSLSFALAQSIQLQGMFDPSINQSIGETHALQNCKKSLKSWSNQANNCTAVLIDVLIY